MATKIDAFEDKVATSKYPWNEWADGSIWELKKGEDYDKPETIRGIVYSHACTRCMSVKTRSYDGGNRFQLQFLPKTKTKRAAK